jgi:tetratricopeptide (TPR) repeat protein
MAQPTSNPKIEELRFRVKTDPKSRLFLPLAEELRKLSQFAEAEQVLRTGLTHHPTYLSAWVSLGRVCRDENKHQDAIEALKKALTLDQGNVVAARLLGDAYLGLGEHVEAIKKYKLVRALVPPDEELDEIIDKLEEQIQGAAPASDVAPASAVEAAPTPPAEAAASHVEAIAPVEAPFDAPAPMAIDEQPSVFTQAPEHPMDETSPFGSDVSEEIATGDVEPMRVAHSQSPFEEPVADLGYSADAFEIEQPPGMHIEPPPLAAELPAPVVDEEEDEVFAPSTEPSFAPFAPPPVAAGDFAKTITMADLYLDQGLVDEARDIYEDVLARDPDNASVRAKLEALSPQPVEVSEEPEAGDTRNPKVVRLESWLAKVVR